MSGTVGASRALTLDVCLVLAAIPTCGRRRADPYTVAMKRGTYPYPAECTLLALSCSRLRCRPGWAVGWLAMFGTVCRCETHVTGYTAYASRPGGGTATTSDGSGGSCWYVVHDANRAGRGRRTRDL